MKRVKREGSLDRLITSFQVSSFIDSVASLLRVKYFTDLGKKNPFYFLQFLKKKKS